MSELSRYCKIYRLKQDYNILYSTKNAATVVFKDSVLHDVLNGNADPDVCSALGKLGLMAPDREQERAEMMDFMKDMVTGRRLSLIVVLNLSCNLACSYCFEGDIKGPLFMSEATEDDLVDFVAKPPAGEKKVSVTFYGSDTWLH